ncbi:MAG TPA: hypothetical protein PKA55_02355 [Rhodoblastus sp.]|nr:hypothetical protein [Rhodoblastus sp.]
MPVKPSRHHEDPVAGAAHIITRLAIALLLIVTPIASVGTRSAIYVLAPVGVALTLVAWLLEPGSRGPRQLRAAIFSVTGMIAVFLFCWAALSLIWTPFGAGPSERFVKSASTFVLAAVAAALLPERTRTSNLYLLPIGVAAGAVAIVALVTFSKSPSLRSGDPEVSLVARAAFGLALLVWPALGALIVREKPKWAIGLAALTVVAELFAGVPLALGATAIGALVFAAAMVDKQRVARALAIAGAALFLIAPVVALLLYAAIQMTPTSPVLPALVWGAYLAQDGLYALVGHGFDAARLGVAMGYLPPATPRSLLFEAWFELGFVGVAAAALLWAQIVRRAGSAGPTLAPFLLAGLTSAYLTSAFGLGVAPVWWVTLLALAGFAFALLQHGHGRAQRPNVSNLPTGE